MANRLEVEIGAKIKDFEDKILKSIRLTDQLRDRNKDLAKSFKNNKITSKEYYSQMAANKNRISKITKASNTYQKSIHSLSGGMNVASKSIGDGSSAMLAFSRTVQDAPFGMMGISNNITNLTEQFGALKKRTGSAGGALKAMLRDLSGFGGITLAISLATSAWLMFGDKIMGTKDKVKSLKEEQEKLTESLENYVLGLGAVEQANLKGDKSAAKKIVKLNLLKKQIEDTTLSNDKRLEGVNELRKIYPAYLKNISDEKALNGGLKTTYDELTTSIMQRSKATASMDMMVDNQKKLITLESQLTAEQLKQTELSQKASKLEAIAIDLIANGAKRTETATTKANTARNKANKSLEETIRLQGEISKLTQQNVDLSVNIKDVGGIADAIVPTNTSSEVQKRVDLVGKGLSNSVKGIQDLITNNPLDLSKAIPVDKVNEAFNVNMNAVLLNAQMKALQFTEGIKQTLGSSFSNTFSQLGESLGNGLRDVDSVIVGGLGSLLSSMGDYLIQAGTAAVLAGTITKLFGSIQGIGAGLAAIAGGVLLKGIGSSISNFGGAGNGGGNSSNAGSSSSSSGSTSFSGGATASNSGGTYVFEIAGTKLVGVLKNTLDRNKNLGGTLSIT